MFTQQTPFLISALQNSVDSATARQIAQAFGNCQQPLSHRASVSLNRSSQPNVAGVLSGSGGNSYSYVGPQFGGDGQFGYIAGNDYASQVSPWALSSAGTSFQASNYYGPSNYYGSDAFTNNSYFNFSSGETFLATYPEAAANAFYNTTQSFQFGPISTVNNSPWYTRMGDVNTFDFGLRLGDTVNNFGGPTFQVAGDSYFDNSFHNNQTVNNQFTTNQITESQEVTNLAYGSLVQVTGDPAAAGPAGPPGRPGDPGPQGLPGGFVQNAVFAAGGYELRPGRVVRAAAPDAPRGDVEWPAGQGKISVPKYKMADSISFKLPSYVFDPDTCTIDVVEDAGVEITVALPALLPDGADAVPLPRAKFIGFAPPGVNITLAPKPQWP